MSILNEIQEVGIGQLLRRRLGIVATGSPAPALAPEIFPCIVMEAERPEWGFLKGERRASAGFDIATGAAVSQLLVRNPPGSNQLIVIERIQLTSSGSCQARIYPKSATPPDLAQMVASTPTDSRWGFPGPSRNTAAQVSSENALAVNPGSFVMARFASAAAGAQLELGVVLDPGAAFMLSTVSAAALQGSVWFRERGVVSGELLG